MCKYFTQHSRTHTIHSSRELFNLLTLLDIWLYLYLFCFLESDEGRERTGDTRVVHRLGDTRAARADDTQRLSQRQHQRQRQRVAQACAHTHTHARARLRPHDVLSLYTARD